MTALHVVVPDGIGDPSRPSGGNAYDRRICSGLAARGWSVNVHAVQGEWPHPDEGSYAALGRIVETIPDGATVLLDGLVASTAPEVLVPQASRLRLVPLVHMPLCHDAERAVLSAAASTVTTSHWSRRTLLGLYSLPAERVHVAEPGVDAADLAPGTPAAGAFLCVGAVIPGKGHDVLVDALATMADVAWECVCVGSLHRDPAFADGLRNRAAEMDGRVRFAGTQSAACLARSYAAADLLVSASRGETYGMVITEALARGLPVVATEVGGVPEALGHGAGGIRPGLLVPPDDPAALAAALRAWLEDPGLRRTLRQAARERRDSLRAWEATTSVLEDVLNGAAR